MNHLSVFFFINKTLSILIIMAFDVDVTVIKWPLSLVFLSFYK